MSQISFSGLASGLDTNAIVRKLVELERRPVLDLQKRRSALEQKQRLITSLTGKLEALSTSANKAAGKGTAAGMKAAVDGTSMTASATPSAKSGIHELEVLGLAQPHRVASDRFSSDSAGVMGQGQLRFTFADGSETLVSFDDTHSPSDLAASIESLDSRLRATVIDDGAGARLVVSSASTGASSGFIVSSTGDSSGLEHGDAVVSTARDAELRYQGIVVRRPGNDIGDLIPGVDLRLKSTGHATIEVSPDTESPRERLDDLVNAYNEVAKFVQGQLSHAGTQRGPETLFGDPGLRSLQRDLGRLLTSALPSGSLTDFGLSLARDGTLSIDDARLSEKLRADPEALSTLLGGAGGLGKQLAEVADRFARSTGILSVQKDTIAKNVSDITKQIERIETRIETSEARHYQRFAKLEQSIAMLEAQLASTGLLWTG